MTFRAEVQPPKTPGLHQPQIVERRSRQNRSACFGSSHRKVAFFNHLHFCGLGQGTLAEGEGSVQMTSLY
jgi:hypothetical protein